MALFAILGAALAMSLFDGGGVAHAQTSQVLVSNLGQTETGASVAAVLLGGAAQGFRTGTNVDGYTLTSLELVLNVFDGPVPTVTLHSGSAAGSNVADFTAPAGLITPGYKVYEFIPTTTVTLNRNTAYWVVVSPTVLGTQWAVVGPGEDATPALGWSIADRGQFNDGTGFKDYGADLANQIRVNGVIEPAATGIPDLVVGSPSVDDSSLATGAAFTLSATVTNAGDGASAATTLRYYRSGDATITTSDTQVGTHAVGALAAGATSDESGGLTAPSTAGTYYYGACVDAVAGESDTTNNCSASVQVDVSEPPPPPPPPTSPDLVVGSPTVSDSSPATGASFTLSATVTNAGDGASAATTLRYYRSGDATITTSDTQVGTHAVGALAAGATSDESGGLTAPSTAGTYYYGACVDAVAGESDTTNNCSASVEVDVSEPPPPPPPPTSPDLVVGLPTVSDSSPATGASFTLSATVTNAGDGASAATTLRYYQSSDATITASDTEVGTDAVAGLAASAVSSQSVELTAPVAAGTYYYGACVDAVADESDTANNCSASAQVDVSEPPPPPPPPTSPDLVVGSPAVSESGPATGASFTLSVTVTNAGDGASAVTTLRYYRSSDATITASDPEVGTAAVGELAAAAASSQSVELTAPSAAGTYYYGACVDAVAGESDTANNCSASVEVDVSQPVPVLPLLAQLLLALGLAAAGMRSAPAVAGSVRSHRLVMVGRHRCRARRRLDRGSSWSCTTEAVPLGPED